MFRLLTGTGNETLDIIASCVTSQSSRRLIRDDDAEPLFVCREREGGGGWGGEGGSFFLRIALINIHR